MDEETQLQKDGHFPGPPASVGGIGTQGHIILSPESFIHSFN